MVLPALNMDDDDIFPLGLKCLGLFSLLDKELAIEKFHVAYRLLLRGGEKENVLICIKWIIDVLSTYGISILLNPETQKNIPSEHLITSTQLGELFADLLDNQYGDEFQALAAEGLCKLFLADILEDFGKKDANSSGSEESEYTESKILQDLITAYFHPTNSRNNALKQTLSFCLPVYAFSHVNHQNKLAQVTGSCIFKLLTDKYSTDPEYVKELNLTLIVQQFIHWCDPENLVNKAQHKYNAPLLQAGSFLQLIEQVPQKPAKKTVINNLNKISLDENLGSNTLGVLLGSIEETVKTIAEKKQIDGNYGFDGLTMRNMDKFTETVRGLYERARDKEAEETQNSQTQEPEQSQPQETQESQEEEAQGEPQEGESGDPEEPGEESGDQGGEESGEGESGEENMDVDEPIRQQELNDIDEFLDAEDQVQYEI